MTLLTWMPVPGTTTPEPSPFVQVTEQARPSPSRTEMWVVEPRREASRRSPKPGSTSPPTKAGGRPPDPRRDEPLDEGRRAQRLGLLHHRHDVGDVRPTDPALRALVQTRH